MDATNTREHARRALPAVLLTAVVLVTLATPARAQFGTFREGALVEITRDNIRVTFAVDSLTLRNTMLQRLLDSLAQALSGTGSTTFVTGGTGISVDSTTPGLYIVTATGTATGDTTVPAARLFARLQRMEDTDAALRDSSRNWRTLIALVGGTIDSTVPGRYVLTVTDTSGSGAWWYKLAKTWYDAVAGARDSTTINGAKAPAFTLQEAARPPAHPLRVTTVGAVTTFGWGGDDSLRISKALLDVLAGMHDTSRAWRTYLRAPTWNAPSVQVDSSGALYTITGLTFDVQQWYGYAGSWANAADDSLNLPQAGAAITTMLLPGAVYPFQFSFNVLPSSGAKTGFGGMTWRADIPPLSADSVLVVRLARRSSLNACGYNYHVSLYKLPFSQGGAPVRTLGQQVDMMCLNNSYFPSAGTSLAIAWQVTMRRKRP